MNVFIDIETIPVQDRVWINDLKSSVTPPGNMKKPETIAEWHRTEGIAAEDEAVHKTSFNGGLGQIFCLSFALESGGVMTIGRDDLTIESEAGLLAQFCKSLKEACGVHNPHFIGHYVGFDLRFLFQRLVVHKIQPGFYIPYNDAPYKGTYTDTMELWAGFKNTVSLDNLCKYLGIPTPKGDVTGAKVWEYVKAGKYQEVMDYNKADVVATREVYKRINFRE